MCQAAVRGFFFKAVGARSGTHQGCADGVHDRHAGVDVGDELALALARVRALAQEHDLGLLLNRRGGREDGRRRSTDDLGGRKRAGHFVRERRETRRRRVSGGVGWCESMKTHDHLPVGHLHESRHGIPPGIPVLLVRRSLGFQLCRSRAMVFELSTARSRLCLSDRGRLHFSCLPRRPRVDRQARAHSPPRAGYPTRRDLTSGPSVAVYVAR